MTTSPTSGSSDKQGLFSELKHILDYPAATRLGETAFYYFDAPTSGPSEVFEEFSKKSAGVFYHKIPEPDVLGGRGNACKAVFTSLLSALTKTATPTRTDTFTIIRMLNDHIVRHQIRMLILDCADNMTTSATHKPLLSDFYALIAQLKSDVMPDRTSIIIAGDSSTLTQLIQQDAWLIGRFTKLTAS